MIKRPHSTQVFTTGEVAKICGVTSQTVINWFDSGTIKGFRLFGSRGDRRVPKEHLLKFMKENKIDLTPLRPLPSQIPLPKRHCWEYFRQTNESHQEGCEGCLINEAQVRQCYLLRHEVGHKGVHCNVRCEDCTYYALAQMVAQAEGWLVVFSRDEGLAGRFEDQLSDQERLVHILEVRSRYELGATVAKYPIKFIVLDTREANNRINELISQLRHDFTGPIIAIKKDGDNLISDSVKSKLTLILDESKCDDLASNLRPFLIDSEEATD